jgi:hypothetical protein
MSKECPECDKGDDGQTLYVHSGVARKPEGYRGFVHFAFRGIRLQLSPEEARAHAWGFMQAAEAAISDEALIRLGRETIGLDEHQATNLLIQLRDARHRREN